MPGVTLKDVDSQEFVKAYADFLKRSGKVEVPEWADLVKTATFKELGPYDPNYFYVRVGTCGAGAASAPRGVWLGDWRAHAGDARPVAAAVARRIYLRKGLGIGALRRSFGGRSNRGTRPSHTKRASGSIIRHACKQLEKLKVIEKDNVKGRRLTSAGRRDMDRIAGQVAAAARK